jgi:hypothetical protein
MKTQGHTLSKMIAGVLVALTVSIAHAQIGGDVIKAKVPFDFSVGTRAFAAGEYSLNSLLPRTMLLRNQGGRVVAAIGTHSVQSSEVQKSAKLVFNTYNGHYFLAQIWNEGRNIGRELPQSPVEIEMATKHSPGPQVALLVAECR